MMSPRESIDQAPSHADLLVSVGQSQDREAFRLLFEYFAPRLTSFMLRRGASHAAAEEIVQEAMVKVWRKASKYDPAKASASTWIFTVGRNVHIDVLRKADRPELDPDDPALVPDAEPDAVARLSMGQDATRIRAAMAKLPDDQRQILLLAFFEEKPHSRIAEELKIPLGTVKSRIRLAFKRMRAEIGDDE